MTTSKQYDYLNRLTSISSTPSNSFAYLYNSADQRVINRLADSSYWRYGYDSFGQVIQGERYWVDETPVAGQQFDYTFDAIGNRIQAQSGGDQNGANLRLAYYTNNVLNQITSRTVPGDVDVMGIGIATNPVTVNGTTAYRKNEYFRSQVAVNNGSSALWTNITVTNSVSTASGHAYVAETPESYTYDVDGNLLSDGRWNYTWDGENRLLTMTSLSGAPSGSLLQLNFAYDYMGRRIQKLVSTNNGTNYTGEYTNNYTYDGWNCLAILNPAFSLSNSFVWGSDLSGSLKGAGGVGGLIKVAYYGTTTTNCFVAYDGAGNVSALINTTDGSTAANFEYGPFGELIRATGPMAKLNPFTFGTYFYDWETDKSYAKNRYYDPSTGRWLSRDPKGEIGFELMRSDPLSLRDQDGNQLAGMQDDGDGDGFSGLQEVGQESVLGPHSTEQFMGCELNRYMFVFNNPVNNSDAYGLDITVETGNVNAGFINNGIHQQVCVGGCNSDHRCFSFGKLPGSQGVQWPEFSKTWLGWNSWVTGAILKGEIYEADPVKGAKIYSRHTTTAAQDANWLKYILTKRLGLQDGYSVARHNCRTYSQWEFRDAPLHW